MKMKIKIQYFYVLNLIHNSKIIKFTLCLLLSLFIISPNVEDLQILSSLNIFLSGIPLFVTSASFGSRAGRKIIEIGGPTLLLTGAVEAYKHYNTRDSIEVEKEKTDIARQNLELAKANSQTKSELSEKLYQETVRHNKAMEEIAKQGSDSTFNKSISDFTTSNNPDAITKQSVEQFKENGFNIFTDSSSDNIIITIVKNIYRTFDVAYHNFDVLTNSNHIVGSISVSIVLIVFNIILCYNIIARHYSVSILENLRNKYTIENGKIYNIITKYCEYITYYGKYLNNFSLFNLTVSNIILLYCLCGILELTVK